MPLEPQPAQPAALVCALLAGSGASLTAGRERLQDEFGLITAESPVYAFDFSQYYRQEMGSELIKQLVCFSARLEPAELTAVKRRTMKLERSMADATHGILRRRVNLDPGLVTAESLVLATTKYSGHRVCIARGLYAEVTLLFQHGGCTVFEWTYPDYRTLTVQRFLLRVRADLLHERRTAAATKPDNAGR